jgi:mono/diheme cytochrome c family protein
VSDEIGDKAGRLGVELVERDAPSSGPQPRRRHGSTGRLPLVRTLALAAVVLVAFVATGCGAVGRVTAADGDAGAGKTLFIKNCGSCHTLADAKSQGTIGPNLDDAFSSDKAQGFDEQTIRDVVRGQIAYADPEGAMKPDILVGQEADDVAIYVAKCTGNPNCGVTASRPAAPPPSGGGTGTTAAAVNGKEIFTQNCASCHTLKDAGTTGTVGPNLDQLKPAEPVVKHQVEVGGGAMPPFKGTLSPAEITAVAKYVSSVAGK